MKLSICSILKDPIMIIRGLIENVKYCFSSVEYEYIVVDNGLDVECIEYLLSEGVKVINGKSMDFDCARNLYLQEASGEWILIVDADERFDLGGVAQLLCVISSNSVADAYALPNLTYTGAGHWGIYSAIRLINNNKGMYYENRSMHSSLVDSAGSYISKNVKNVACCLHHFDQLLNEDISVKRSRNLEKLKIELTNNPNDLKSNTYIGLEYAALGDYSQAFIHYDRVLNLDPEYNDALLFKTQLLMHFGKHAEATLLLKKLNNRSLYKDRVLTMYAEIAYRENDLRNCFNYLNEMVVLYPSYSHGHINLGVLYCINQNYEEAYRHLATALELNPYLLRKEIYFSKNSMSIYKFQDVFLSYINNYPYHMYDLCRKIGNKEKERFWYNLNNIIN